jgi:hypothetical protein
MEHVYDIDTYNQPTQTIMCNFVTKHDRNKPMGRAGLDRSNAQKDNRSKKGSIKSHRKARKMNKVPKMYQEHAARMEITRRSSLDEDHITRNQTDSPSVSFALSPPGPIPAAGSFQSIHSQSSE